MYLFFPVANSGIVTTFEDGDTAMLVVVQQCLSCCLVAIGRLLSFRKVVKPTQRRCLRRSPCRFIWFVALFRVF